eukprot:jgi/Ulvmu1/9643/UM054_0075.1
MKALPATSQMHISSAHASCTPARSLALNRNDGTLVSAATKAGTVQPIYSSTMAQFAKGDRPVAPSEMVTADSHRAQSSIVRTTMPLLTPGCRMPLPSTLTETPRSSRSMYGELRTPATTLFRKLRCSPPADAMTPPHLDAIMLRPAGPLASTVHNGPSALVPRTPATLSSPGKALCPEVDQADENKILPPHLSSTEKPSYLEGICGLHESPVCARRLCASPVQQRAEQLPVSMPAPTPSSPAPLYSDCSEPNGSPPVGVKAATDAIRTNSHSFVQHNLSCPNQQAPKTEPSLPPAPVPSPAFDPCLPSRSDDVTTHVPGLRSFITAVQQDEQTLGTTDMEYLCSRLGRLSTRRAPSAPLRHALKPGFQQIAVPRAASWSPASSPNHKPGVLMESRAALGRHHAEDRVLPHLQPRSEPPPALSRQHLLLPLQQMHHCRPQKGLHMHEPGSWNDTAASPEMQCTPERPMGGCSDWKHWQDPEDPLAMYNPQDLVFFPRVMSAGVGPCRRSTPPCAAGPESGQGTAPTPELLSQGNQTHGNPVSELPGAAFGTRSYPMRVHSVRYLTGLCQCFSLRCDCGGPWCASVQEQLNGVGQGDRLTASVAAAGGAGAMQARLVMPPAGMRPQE